MKRLLLILIILLTTMLIVGCRRAEEVPPPATQPPVVEATPEATEPDAPDEPFMPTVPVLEPGSLRIATPRGPAALGLLYLMEASGQGTTRNELSFHLVGAPDEIPPLLMRGEIDIAAVPPNMAAILYNNPALDIQVIAVSTLGVLHIVDTTGTISSVEDLRGRTIFSSGVGGTPEFILNHVLSSNGLTPGTDVNIEFRPEHTEIAALLEGGMAEIAMLPEPFATTTVMRVENLEYALDLTEEWNRISPDAGLAMTSVIATREAIESQPEAIQIFL
ncbi:MAG: ABC transporter substrate-binding protein, partial [Clostridiales bacterium]|nr:ABC transporter substrate-binding protein [Clostridiales bacterium]